MSDVPIRTAQLRLRPSMIRPWVEAWIAERCRRSPFFESKATPLYENFIEWCAATGQPEATQTAFGRALSGLGFTPSRDANGNIWRAGIVVAAERTLTEHLPSNIQALTGADADLLAGLAAWSRSCSDALPPRRADNRSFVQRVFGC